MNNNMEACDCLEEMEDAINALKMLTTLCVVSREKELYGMSHLLSPILEKQEKMLAQLWKAQAKK